jgi:hypothetical protein
MRGELIGRLVNWSIGKGGEEEAHGSKGDGEAIGRLVNWLIGEHWNRHMTVH